MPFLSKITVIGACIGALLMVAETTMSQTERKQSGPTPSQSAAKERLLEESQRVQSPRFLDQMSAPPASANLVGQLDTLARDLEVAWLVRGLDELPLPADMAHRLTSEGIAHRKKIVSNLEEIARLTLSKPTKPLDIQDRSSPLGDSGPLQKVATQKATRPIEQEKLYAYIQDNISLKFQFLQRDYMTKACGATVEQLSLSQRLDEVTRSLIAYWGRNNLNAAEVAERWPSRAIRLREAIVDRSESILFDAILLPAQTEKFKRAYWTVRGLKSLLDPELASRLSIGKDQRAMIQNALDESARKVRRINSDLRPWMRSVTTPEKAQQTLQAKELISQTKLEAEQPVWDLLTPSQISIIGKLLGEKALKPQPTRQNKISVRSPAS